MTDPPNPNRLQLLSMTLAYDDTRFFGSVIFTRPDHPDEQDEAVFINHTEEPPWFRLTNVNPDAQDPAAPEMASGPDHAVHPPLHARPHRPQRRRLPSALTRPAHARFFGGNC